MGDIFWGVKFFFFIKIVALVQPQDGVLSYSHQDIFPMDIFPQLFGLGCWQNQQSHCHTASLSYWCWVWWLWCFPTVGDCWGTLPWFLVDHHVRQQKGSCASHQRRQQFNLQNYMILYKILKCPVNCFIHLSVSHRNFINLQSKRDVQRYMWSDKTAKFQIFCEILTGNFLRPLSGKNTYANRIWSWYDLSWRRRKLAKVQTNKRKN